MIGDGSLGFTSVSPCGLTQWWFVSDLTTLFFFSPTWPKIPLWLSHWPHFVSHRSHCDSFQSRFDFISFDLVSIWLQSPITFPSFSLRSHLEFALDSHQFHFDSISCQSHFGFPQNYAKHNKESDRQRDQRHKGDPRNLNNINLLTCTHQNLSLVILHDLFLRTTSILSNSISQRENKNHTKGTPRRARALIELQTQKKRINKDLKIIYQIPWTRMEYSSRTHRHLQNAHNKYPNLQNIIN